MNIINRIRGTKIKGWWDKKINKIDTNSIVLGIKKGINIPMLPSIIIKFNHFIVVRILRFICGLCLLLVLTSVYNKLPEVYHSIVILLGFGQSIYILVMMIIRVCYGCYVLIYKRDLLEVRNSPLNYYASVVTRAIYCAKIGCGVTGGTAAFVAAGASFDNVLEAAGREKIFVPMMGDIFKKVFGEAVKPTSLQEVMRGNRVGSSNTDLDNVKDMVDRYYKASPDEKNLFLKEINENLDKIRSNKK